MVIHTAQPLPCMEPKRTPPSLFGHLRLSFSLAKVPFCLGFSFAPDRLLYFSVFNKR